MTKLFRSWVLGQPLCTVTITITVTNTITNTNTQFIT